MRFFLPLRATRAAAMAGALTVVVVLAAPAGNASAKVAWTGIGGVKLGVSLSEVRAVLGQPSEVKEAHAPQARRHVYRRAKLVVTFSEGRVVAVETTSRAQRTPRGVRVGMSKRKMRRLIRGERCSYAEGRTICSLERGATVMDFVTRKRRVVAIAVSRVR
jgi:hypothetical protein